MSLQSRLTLLASEGITDGLGSKPDAVNVQSCFRAANTDRVTENNTHSPSFDFDMEYT